MFGPYELVQCEGDAPLVCVTEGGAAIGLMEYLTFPAESLPDFVAAYEEAGVEAALQEHAAAYVETFLADRAATCPDYEWTSADVGVVSFAGLPGVKYGFSGTTPDGAVAERALQYATFDDTTLHIVGIDALDPDLSCLAPLGSEFAPATLDAFEPVLDQLIVASVLEG